MVKLTVKSFHSISLKNLDLPNNLCSLIFLKIPWAHSLGTLFSVLPLYFLLIFISKPSSWQLKEKKKDTLLTSDLHTPISIHVFKHTMNISQNSLLSSFFLLFKVFWYFESKQRKSLPFLSPKEPPLSRVYITAKIKYKTTEVYGSNQNPVNFTFSVYVNVTLHFQQTYWTLQWLFHCIWTLNESTVHGTCY